MDHIHRVASQRLLEKAGFDQETITKMFAISDILEGIKQRVAKEQQEAASSSLDELPGICYGV